MPGDTEERRPTRSFIERERRPRRQSSQHPARHLHTGCGGGTDFRRARTSAEGRASSRAAAPAPAAAVRPQAEHPRHLGRRCRHRQHQRLFERSDGLRDPEHRPHRPRGHQVPALLWRAVVHRRPRGVPHRPARHSDRPDQGRLPRRADGHEPARSLDRRPAQESRLRHRPVRQEPCRRPQRIAADRERLRRVLRQSLSSQRRGGAGTAGLSEGPGLPRQIRSARRAEMQGDATGTIPRSIRASARSASRRSRTPAR